jgi:Uma2 family endonuclease
MTIKLTFQDDDDKQIDPPYTILKEGISDDDFWSFANEDIKCELLGGMLVIHSPANTEHETFFSYLSTILRFYLDWMKVGKIFGSRLVMHLSPIWNPEPDLMVILNDKLESLSQSRLEGPADLIIEILSDSTRSIDLEKKLPQYLKSGVTEVWIIDPADQKLSIYWENDHIEYISTEDTIIHSIILPQLNFKAKWLWDQENFPTDLIIQQMLNEK